MMYLAATGSSLEGMPSEIGVMIGPRTRGLRPVYEGRKFALDNDAFHGKFDPDKFKTHLARFASYADNCLLVATPDVVGDALATHQLFSVWAQVIQDAGLPPAYVLQNGAEHLPIPDQARALFLGGSDAWKMRHLRWAATLAQERGLWLHVGRVNSQRRLMDCAAAGAHSADGTHIAYKGVERGLAEIQRWTQAARTQKGLYL